MVLVLNVMTEDDNTKLIYVDSSNNVVILHTASIYDNNAGGNASLRCRAI
jgi:hypothetical protein